MADRKRGFRLAGLGALCTLALATAACGNRVPGTPLAAAATTPNRHGAPSVPNPIDASRFLPKPCTTLTPAQLDALNLAGPGTTDVPLANYTGPNCAWDAKDGTPVLMFGFVTSNKNGLADIYRGHDQGQFPGYFVVTTVDGFPAVFTSGVDARSKGFCTLLTGISDSLAILVDETTLGTGKDPCEGARHTTSLILSTLRGG
jgi:hypothetical protein